MHLLNLDDFVENGFLGHDEAVLPIAGRPCGQTMAVHKLNALCRCQAFAVSTAIFLVNPKRLDLLVRNDEVLIVFPLGSTSLHQLRLVDELYND